MVSNTFTAVALSASITGIETHRHLREKRYEIKDHLGNVRAVVSDIKNAENYSLSASSWKFLADVRSLSNYYPYGMEIEAGSWSGGDYNYGYNGMLKEGIGKDIYNTHFRNLSGEGGRWWSPDPMEPAFPWQSPYISMSNNPLNRIDPNGDADYIINEEGKKGFIKSTELRIENDCEINDLIYATTPEGFDNSLNEDGSINFEKLKENSKLLPNDATMEEIFDKHFSAKVGEGGSAGVYDNLFYRKTAEGKPDYRNTIEGSATNLGTADKEVNSAIQLSIASNNIAMYFVHDHPINANHVPSSVEKGDRGKLNKLSKDYGLQYGILIYKEKVVIFTPSKANEKLKTYTNGLSQKDVIFSRDVIYKIRANRGK